VKSSEYAHTIHTEKENTVNEDIEKIVEKVVSAKLGNFVKEQTAIAERSRLLDRIEDHARESGAHSDHIEDIRAHLEHRAAGGEDIGATPISAHIVKLKASKPRYFAASPTAKDGQSVDHAKSTRQEYASFMAKFAPGIRV
jgi:hypothetical protein